MTPATPISIIRQHKSHDDTIEAFEGTITEVYKRRTGTGTHGDYSFQDGKMRDAAGDIIECTFASIDDVSHEKGKTYRFTSTVNTRGKTNGISVKDSEYNGVKTRKLQITKTAEWVNMADARPVAGLAQAVDQRMSQPAASQPAASPAKARQPAASQPPASEDERSFLLNVKKRAWRLAGMHGICYDAAVADALKVFDRHGYAMTPAAVGMIADKIFIECVRRTDPDLMPMDPWANGYKGEPLSVLIDELNKQVMEHRDAQSKALSALAQAPQQQAPPRAAGPSPAPAAPPAPEVVDDTDDTIPF